MQKRMCSLVPAVCVCTYICVHIHLLCWLCLSTKQIHTCALMSWHIQIYMRVLKCIHVCKYIHVCSCIDTYIYTCVYSNTNMYANTYMYTYTHTHTLTHMDLVFMTGTAKIYTHTYRYSYTHACLDVHACRLSPLILPICMHICTCMNIYIYIYIHIYCISTRKYKNTHIYSIHIYKLSPLILSICILVTERKKARTYTSMNIRGAYLYIHVWMFAHVHILYIYIYIHVYIYIYMYILMPEVCMLACIFGMHELCMHVYMQLMHA